MKNRDNFSNEVTRIKVIKVWNDLRVNYDYTLRLNLREMLEGNLNVTTSMCK